jgi:hypothetical protein
MISKASLGASRKTTTIGGIKGTSLLKALLLLCIIKLLSRKVVKLHIRINKGAKRRSWRKTGLLLQMPHALVLLGLTVAEVRHEPLKRMASSIHGTMTTATPTTMRTPTLSRDSS